MSEKEERILKTFGENIPELSKEAQETLITFGNGYIAGYQAGRKKADQEADMEKRGA